MTSVWVSIDATEGGEVDATTWVGGLPLVSRQVRQLARQGAAGAVVRCGGDPARRAAVERALAKRSGPAGFAVEVESGRDTAFELDGRALYRNDAVGRAVKAGGPAPEPDFRVRTRADVKTGLARLFATLRKNVDHDGEFAFYVVRPVARLITRLLLPTTISPNQVTLVALACGLAAAALCALGGAQNAAIAGALFIAGVFIDCVDGELARLRLEYSRFGEWLDSVGDDVCTLSLTSCVGIGLVGDGAHPAWRTVALATAATGAVVITRLYRDLYRLGLPADTAVYPWFFRKDEAARAVAGAAGVEAPRPERRGLLAALGKLINFIMRRDVYATIVAILLIADQRRVALAALLAGVSGLALVYFVHLVVTTARGGGGRATSRP